jgi:hypothetical protein
MFVRDRRLALPVFAWALLGPLAHKASADQVETIVTVTEGNEPQKLRYGCRTSGAAISPATDIDTYLFEALQGDVVRITVQSTSGGWDPQFVLYDPALNLIPGSSCGGACCYTCTATSDIAITTSGQYTLVVSDVGSDSGGTYTLEIDRIPDLVPTVVECNTTTTDAIQAGADTDFFEFHGEANALVQINFQSTSGGWDPVMIVLDPNDVQIASGSCGGACCYTCSFTIYPVPQPVTGTYKLVVYDSGLDSGGTYQFTLQFITGCPTPPPAATPYCTGDGSGFACPCGPGAAGAGCPNSFGSGGLLASTGVASVSADTVQLQSSGLPPSTFALYLQGAGAANAGYGYVFGDGLLCVSGSLIRLGARSIAGSGAFGYGVSGDPSISVRGGLSPTGGTRYYQAWYRNPVGFCTPGTFNLTNGIRIAWVP